MAKKLFTGFDTLFDLAILFIERQKGMGDYAAWADFLVDVQKKGFELSDGMKSYFGFMMELMKNLYEKATATREMEVVLLEIFEHTLNFIKKTKGVWNPSEWDIFWKDLMKRNVDLTDEMRSYLIESFKAVREFYTALPPEEIP